MNNHWHILGAGAMGGLFACALQQAGNEVSILLRPGLKADGTAFTIGLSGGSISGQYTFGNSAASDSSPIHHLLITTKAYDVMAGVAGIAHRLHSSSQILLMVNGMGLLEQLEKLYPQLGFYAATTTHGAFRKTASDIVHAGEGDTRVGSVQAEQAPPWFPLWNNLDWNCRWEADINSVLWQKLAVNCAINPLTALHRCKNGALLSNPELTDQVAKLCEEISNIARGAGQQKAVENLHETVIKVIKGTAENQSSMYQDVLNQRKTEIEYISGFLVNAAKLNGVPAPLNKALLARVNELHP